MSKTFKAKIQLTEDQVIEVIAAYFGVERKDVCVLENRKGIEIAKDINVPDKPNTEYIPIPVNPPRDWWNDDWWRNPILHPVITWCNNEATTITGGKSITDATLHAEWTNADALTNKETTGVINNGL